MLTYVELKAKAAVRFRDSGMAVISTTDFDDFMSDAFREAAQYVPHEVEEVFTIESRTGTATSTTAGSLVDATKSQFVAGDVGKDVYNKTDKTWARITTHTSATTVALSKDIMASGEQYEIYNKGCTSKFQINISGVADYFDKSIIKVEYPKGERRSFDLSGNILTIKKSSVDDSKVKSSGTQPDTEVNIWFKSKHKVSQLTTLTGAVNNAGGYSAGDTSMILGSLQTTGTIEADQEFTIADTRGTYRVTADATITAGAASISFYPGLESDVDHTTVVTFIQSTLTPELEPIMAELIAALAAISESMNPYQQAQEAIQAVALTTLAIAEVATGIDQAISDIATGRTETDKVSVILDTANTELDKIGARLDEAIIDIASGGVEADKISTIVDTAETAIAAVSARITQALVDIASARTAAGDGAEAIGWADVEFGLMNTQVDLAVTALAEGEPLLNTVPVAGGAPEFMGQANADVGAAQGFLISGQSYLQEAGADTANANSDLGIGSGELQAGLTKIREAQASLQQANTDMGANASYINSAIAEIRAGSAYSQEAGGYFQEGASRLGVNASYLQLARAELSAANGKMQEGNSNLQKAAMQLRIVNAGRVMESWGRTELERVKAKLRRSVPNKYRTSQVYTRG